MALADLPVEDRVLQGLRRAQRAQGIGDGRPRLPETLCELLLRQFIRLHQEPVCPGRLDRVEIGALDVFDERELEPISHVIAHDRRDRRPAGQTGGEHAAMAGHEFETVAVS